MRFGRHFREQQNPAWQLEYVKYDRYKFLLKNIPQKVQDDSRCFHTEGIIDSLHGDFERVDAFYNKIAGEIYDRARRHLVVDGAGPEVADDLKHLNLALAAFAVHNFGEVNKAAFVRLLEKVVRVRPALEERSLFQRTVVLDSGLGRPTILGVFHRLQRYFISDLYPFPTTDRRDFEKTRAVFFYNGHSHEEQLIHAAASGDEKGVRYLVGVGALPNCTEKVTGRTPLCYASKYGQTSMVKFLLAAGANPNVKDCAGWTITEHAAYRGHEEVLKMVLDAIKGHKSVVGTTRIDELSLNGFAGSKTDHAIALDSPALPLTSVIVNLGSPHSASHHSPIQLVSPSLASTDGSLSVEVSVFGAAEDPCVVTLPVMEDLSNKPCVFTVDATMNRAALLVKLFRSQGHTRVLEGVGSALIGSLDEDTTPILENVGELKKIPLHAEQHETLVAVFSYSLLVVKAAPKEVSSTSGLPWHFGEGIGGHRGMGQNRPEWRFLQMGENTIEAFEAAMRLGAAFVEFDVQVTKDLIPIIYHDFLVSETGIDAPVHALSYQQFQSANDSSQPQRQRQFDHRRSRSLSPASTAETLQIEKREKLISETVEGHIMEFKPNIRGAFIQAPFISLEQACAGLDPAIPFNIELKYPMLSETKDWQMSPEWLALNTFLDTILTTLAHVGPRYASRRILLSSFSADICIPLSLKKVPYPIYFLNDARAPTPDSRASSFQSALHFASRWNLDGIVLESTPLVACPRLIGLAEKRGLGLATYGAKNSEVEAVRLQKEGGVEGVITDRVRLVTRG